MSEWKKVAMSSKINCELVFPTTIFFCDLSDSYREELIDYTRYCRASDPSGVEKTNMGGGWQSRDNWLDRSPCRGLKADLEILVSDVANSLKIKEKLKIYNSWVNVNPKGAYNVAHTHPRNLFSGCYYLQTPEDCGNIVFHSPLHAKEMIDASYKEMNAVTANHLIYPAIAGRVYLFPAWLQHSVQANRSDGDRISMSFNVFFEQF
jgi:uncharacterized protein (TIGR02466 family)